MIRIHLAGELEEQAALDLADLESDFVGAGVEVTGTSLRVPGVKTELVIGLAIASLTVSSLSAVIAVLNFWKSQRRTVYRISFETQDKDVPLDDVTAAAIRDAVERQQITSIKIEKA